MSSILKNPDIRIEPLTVEDLKEIPLLQPEGWADILPSIKDYCVLDFCFPLKATLGNTLVGIGTAIFHRSTAWLGHIIVHKDYRNFGIGTTITKSLIELVQKTHCKSIFLIATALGEPVYKKLGFNIQTHYVFFENGFILEEGYYQIKPFEQKYTGPLLALDHSISGEARVELFQNHFTHARLYIENNNLNGFYLPTLGEGLIISHTPNAGLALMRNRYADHKKICLPIDNHDGINFLLENGFTELRRASRMVLGDNVPWQASKMFSRIGGNLG
jgi:GNAT superfamily N-acetyltransferase